MYKLKLFFVGLVLSCPGILLGQENYVARKGEVEIFSGLELNYRDIAFEKQYEVLLNLTPGLKWHPAKHTQVAVMGYVPLANDYGSYYKNPTLQMATVSQELRLGRLALKPTAGIFSMDRYGVDLKAMYPLNAWLALQGQVGLTGLLSTVGHWQMSRMQRVMALAGATAYLSRWNTQVRLLGGRFVSQDYGVYAEGMRHFNRASVGVYLQYSEIGVYSDGFNGGFKIVMALPPYKRRHRTVTLRPASNFRLTYNMNADPLANKTYATDPEENERHGWFSPDILPWGQNLHYDFQQ